MHLIAILISLAVDRFMGHLEDLRRFQWIMAYHRWLRKVLPANYNDGPIVLLLVVLTPVLVLVILLSLLNTLLFFVAAILVLIYCIGPKSLDSDMEGIAYADSQNSSSAVKTLEEQFTKGKIYRGGESANPNVIDALFVEANDRLFAVLFWFVVLGPVGALLYRISSYYSQQLVGDEPDTLTNWAIHLHKILDFLPAHGVALSYCVSGSFTHTFEEWRLTPKFSANESVNAGILISTGRAAALFHANSLDLTSQAKLVMDLIWRTVWVWTVVVAVFTLSGWIS